MTIIELDSLRADTMRALLNEEGRREIWKYDIITTRQAIREAISNYNFDSMQVGGDADKAGKQYALVGPGIEDHHFTTPEELVKILEWLCRDGGYLSCYVNAIAEAARTLNNLFDVTDYKP